MITTCPTCKGDLSSFHLMYEFLYCMEGHVVTLVPIDRIDIGTLVDLQLNFRAKKA